MREEDPPPAKARRTSRRDRSPPGAGDDLAVRLELTGLAGGGLWESHVGKQPFGLEQPQEQRLGGKMDTEPAEEDEDEPKIRRILQME